MLISKEEKDRLYKGLFWIKDVINIVKDSVCFLVPFDKEGKGDVMVVNIIGQRYSFEREK